MNVGYAVASSNGCVSNPSLSNNTSGTSVVNTGTIKSANFVRVIASPTPSTTQVSVEYLDGATFPKNSTTIPLENSMPLLDV